MDETNFVHWNGWTYEKRIGIIWWWDSQGIHRCGYDLNGQPCRKFPPKDNARCWLHSEKTRRRELTRKAIVRNSRMTSYLPPVYHGRFEELLQNSDNTDLELDAALLRMRQEDLLMRLEEGQFDLFESLQISQKLGEALHNQKTTQALAFWSTLHNSLSSHTNNDKAWEEVEKVINKRRSLVSTIEQIRSRRQTAITANEFRTVLDRIFNAFSKINGIEDETERVRAFQTEIVRVLEALTQ